MKNEINALKRKLANAEHRAAIAEKKLEIARKVMRRKRSCHECHGTIGSACRCDISKSQ